MQLKSLETEKETEYKGKNIPMSSNVKHSISQSQSLLDLFWKLAVTDEEERINAATQLVATLRKNVENGDEDDSLQYSVKRLLVGLSSNRQAAPLGFATALCEILREFSDNFHTAQLIAMIKECLQPAKQDNRSHHTHCSIGKILAYSSLIRSGIIKQAGDADVRAIVSFLVTIKTRYTMLSSAATDCLIQLCQALPPDDLRDVVTELLGEELTSGWEKCTADTLQLLLVLQEKKVLDSEYISEHWGVEKLVCRKTFPYLARIMVQSTTHHPIVHPVNAMIVSQAVAAGRKVSSKLWKDVIIGEVYNTEKHSRCYMVYQLISEVLKSSDKIQSVASILCPELIGPLMRQMTNRDTYLHKAAVKLMADIVDVIKKTSKGSLQLEILRCLLTEPGSFMFDSITATRTISNIISNLSADAAKEFSQDLMSVISAAAPLCGRRGDGIVSWSSITLTHLLNIPSMRQDVSDSTWQTNILKFLFLHSCFVLKQPLPKLDHCEEVVTLTDSDRLSIKEALLKGLSILSTCQTGHKGGSSKKADGLDYMTILDSLFKYASKLVSSTESVETFRVVSPQELAIWNQVETTCKKIDKHQKSVGEDKSKSAMFEAFQLMLQLFGLHLYIVESSERAEVMDTIQEITTCFSKAVSRTRTNKEEPEWCEVITEVLISLMSKSSHLLRTVSTSVFTKILPMCNTASIQLILDVFQSEDDEFDADREEVNMEEDVTSPDETDVSETAGDEGEDSSTSSDESDDEDEEEHGEEVDENMRATLQAALGPAAITDADQEDDDLSDSEMFKLDDALSAAFRGMMSKNKNSPAEVEKRRQIIYFKLRCLDLVEVIVKHSTDGEHLMELVVPLLSLTEASYKEKEMKEIGKKAQTLYNHLTSLKKIPTATVTDLDRATDRVKDILTLSTNAYVWPIMKDLANGLNLMIKLLSHAEYKPSQKSAKSKTKGKDVLIAAVVGEVQAALKEFLNKRESKYSHTLFQSLFDRQAPLFWGSNSDLLEAISNEGVRVFCRTQACSLLSQLINRTVTSQDNGATWLKFTKSLQVAIEKVSKYSAVNYKAGFLPEFFGVLNKVKTVDKTVVLDLGSFEGISEKFNKDLQKLYRKLVSANSQPAVGVSPGRKRKVSATFPSSDSDKPTKAMKTP